MALKTILSCWSKTSLCVLRKLLWNGIWPCSTEIWVCLSLWSSSPSLSICINTVVDLPARWSSEIQVIHLLGKYNGSRKLLTAMGYGTKDLNTLNEGIFYGGGSPGWEGLLLFLNHWPPFSPSPPKLSNKKTRLLERTHPVSSKSENYSDLEEFNITYVQHPEKQVILPDFRSYIPSKFSMPFIVLDCSMPNQKGRNWNISI